MESKGRVLVLEALPSANAAVAKARSGLEIGCVTKERGAIDRAAQEAFDVRALTQEFDDLVARMRTSKARAAARQLFTAP
jgi:hypothetical protein